MTDIPTLRWKIEGLIARQELVRGWENGPAALARTLTELRG